MSDQLKICSACEEPKPHSEFHKSASSKDGLYPRCKNCSKYGAPMEIGKHDIDDSPFDPDLEATRRVEQLVARYGREEAITKIKLERFAT